MTMFSFLVCFFVDHSSFFSFFLVFLQMSTTVLLVAIGLTFSALILTIAWLLKASGLFAPIRIKVTKPSFEHLTILYKFQQGDYSQSAEIFRDILNYSPSHRTLGIYYDKPDDVSRSNVDQRSIFVLIRFLWRNDGTSPERLSMRRKMKK